MGARPAHFTHMRTNFLALLLRSPHVASFNERIAINGAPIAPSALDGLVGRHRAAIEEAQGEEGGALTHFEVTTALAYKHFQEQEVGLCVVPGCALFGTLLCLG
jgi:folylpolyglutamate synthase/dihydropteroate synthase